MGGPQVVAGPDVKGKWMAHAGTDIAVLDCCAGHWTSIGF